MRVPSNALAPVDTSWFDANPEAYLERDDFQEFQKISSVDLSAEARVNIACICRQLWSFDIFFI